MANNTNPYVLALFTAILAGTFSLFGSYCIAKYQVSQERIDKEKEHRVQAYKDFLKNVHRTNSPIISKFLHLGSLSETVATDSEIQTLEDNIEELVYTTNIQEIYWKLNSDFSQLNIYGDEETNKICADILDLVSLNFYRINWETYPLTIQNLYNDVSRRQLEGIAMGWEEKVRSEDRISIIMTSRLFQELIMNLQKTSKEH